MKQRIFFLILLAVVSSVTAYGQVDFTVQKNQKKSHYLGAVNIVSGTPPFTVNIIGRHTSTMGYTTPEPLCGGSNTYEFLYDVIYTITVTDSTGAKKKDSVFIPSWETFPWVTEVNNGVVELHTWDFGAWAPVFQWFSITSGQLIQSRISTETFENSSQMVYRSYQDTPGTYAVLVKNEFLGADTVVFVTVSDPLGVQEINTDEISVFPNPTTGITNLSHIAKEVKLLSNDGRIILKANNTNRINLSGIPAGMYYLIADNLPAKKVIKQ